MEEIHAKVLTWLSNWSPELVASGKVIFPGRGMNRWGREPWVIIAQNFQF